MEKQMSYHLPLTGTQAREAMNIERIAYLLSPKMIGKVKDLDAALESARQYLEENTIADSLNVVCVQTSGNYEMIKVSRTDWEVIWNFGTGND
jgi:hypothetical protein